MRLPVLVTGLGHHFTFHHRPNHLGVTDLRERIEDRLLGRRRQFPQVGNGRLIGDGGIHVELFAHGHLNRLDCQAAREVTGHHGLGDQALLLGVASEVAESVDVLEQDGGAVGGGPAEGALDIASQGGNW